MDTISFYMELKQGGKYRGISDGINRYNTKPFTMMHLKS